MSARWIGGGLAVVGFALLVATVAVALGAWEPVHVAMNFSPEAGTSIRWNGAETDGWLRLALGGLTGIVGLLVGVAAIVFAAIVCGGVGAVLLSPVLMIAVTVWLAARPSRRSPPLLDGIGSRAR